MSRTLSHIRIGPHHPGRGEPSTIELSVVPSDRKSSKADVYTITVEQALFLAEQALVTVRVTK